MSAHGHSRPRDAYRSTLLVTRTLTRWKEPILAWHEAHTTNAGSDGANNLQKRVKRGAFGMTNHRHYRVRSLLFEEPVAWQYY